jgi:hypothetical protein
MFRTIPDCDGSIGYVSCFQWPDFASMLNQQSSVVKWLPAQSCWSPPCYCTCPDQSKGPLTVTITGVEMQINGKSLSGGSLKLPIAKMLVPSAAPPVNGQYLESLPDGPPTLKLKSEVMGIEIIY